MNTKTIKTGTKVTISPKWDKASFHRNAGVGTVVGRWHNDYTVNFGKMKSIYNDMIPYEVNIPAEFLVIIKAAPKGYKHPKSPTYNKIYEFIRHLHGSGIDADWSVEETKTSWRASNSYHAMDEWGGYDGWADFTIIFPKGESMGEFKLEFNGQDSQRMNQKHMLREYLEDTVASMLSELKMG